MRNAAMFFAALGLTVTANAAPTQWTTASGGNDHWYEFISGNFTWSEALADAAAHAFSGMTGYLATATSASENTFISVTLGNGNLGWLGASDNGNEGVWTWRSGPENGQALTYFNWNSGEPNNCCGGENYLQTNWGNSTGGWNDHGGPGNATQRNGYYLEFSAAVPESGTWTMLAAGCLVLSWWRRRSLR